MSRSKIVIAALLTLGLAACSETTAPSTTATPDLAVAKPAVCATATVTNNPQTVVNLAMPRIRYTLANCGSRRLTVVVTVYETFGSLSGLCPAPIPAPVTITMAAGKRQALSFPTYRGACGFANSSNQGVLVQGTAAWQEHRLMVSVRNAADGTLLSTSPFIWRDAPSPI